MNSSATSVRRRFRDAGSPAGSPPAAPRTIEADTDSGASPAEGQNLLARLASLSDAAYSELLAVPAEHALDQLGATSVSLSRWERDRGVLRCLVNVGELAPGDVRFPDNEIYELAEWESILDLTHGKGKAYQLDDPDLSAQGRQLLQRYGHRSAVSVPVYIGDRLWGELWATKRSTLLAPTAIQVMTQVADDLAGMIALAERLEYMARLAFQDPLTGLGNRRQLDDTLHALLAEDGPGSTVIICDVNDLKRVNDEDGHEAGDRVIIAVADALSSAVAPVPGAVAVRLGGDEFAILLPGSERTTAISTVEAAARRLAGHSPPVTISCGIAVVAAGTSLRDALSVADAAQYSAKRRGSLLFVAAGLEPAPTGPRRRHRGRTDHAERPPVDVHVASARAIVSLCRDLVDAPATDRGKLLWLAERLLTVFDFDHWTLSTVDLLGDRLLGVQSMGLRAGRPVDDATDLLVDTAFPLADFLLSERIIVENGWFTVDTEDDLADPAERAVLTALGKRYVVALGWSKGRDGLLLEAYGHTECDIELLGATTALAAGALLGGRCGSCPARHSGRSPGAPGPAAGCRIRDNAGMHPRAGQPARPDDLVDLPHLVSEYYTREPDLDDPGQQVVFGTSGHRGSSLTGAFTESHIVAITQAICEYRTAQGTDGPLFIGRDTHGLSEPAWLTALEVLAANDVTVLIDSAGRYTPTPAVSHAILRHNAGRTTGTGLADGIVVTPSHNPPSDGGFKYNPPHGGPAGTEATTWIADRANGLLRDGLRGVKRVPAARARASASTSGYDFMTAYVDDLPTIVDLDAIRSAGLRIGADPLGGASVDYWAAIAERHRIDLTVVNPLVDATWRFMTLDWDGKIRMDCSSPSAMASLVQAMRGDGSPGAAPYDIATGNDADSDRHGIVTPDGGLMNPNHFLAVAIGYLFGSRDGWGSGAAVGKTLVSSSMIDRVAADLGRRLLEVPVGFKWFVPGLLDGSVGFGGEESAGASFLRRDGSVWTTDKDGIVLALLATEIQAVTGRSPSQHYADLVARFGEPSYARVDAPATREQKAALAALSPDAVTATELAGEPITAKLTRAPGNDAAIGGLKVTTESAWFAARPSGTEDVYKIYAESFRGAEHLAQVQAAAREVVSRAID